MWSASVTAVVEPNPKSKTQIRNRNRNRCMIDIRKLKELVRLMVDNDLTELDLRDSEEQVTMRRFNSSSAPQVIMGAGPVSQALGPTTGLATPAQASATGNGAA